MTDESFIEQAKRETESLQKSIEEKKAYLEAKTVTDNLRKAIEERKELLDKEMKLKTMENMERMGGRSFAGEVPKEISAEEKQKSDLQNYFKGTALEHYIK